MADGILSEPSAAIALRNSFGDRKLPDISRKITACVTCRKLKIKCNMKHAKPPCARCRAQNLSCVVNKSLQTLLENDATWKERMEQRIQTLERALLDTAGSDAMDVTTDVDHMSSSRAQAIRSAAKEPTRDAFAPSLNLSCNLGAFPASSITTAASAKLISDTPYRPDLIARGVISLSTAEEHLAFFLEYLDPLIHHVLGVDATIAGVRTRSSFLTTSICTVASLCSGSDEYLRCFAELKHEISQKLFADRYCFDDVLALSIGAFWLRDISSALQGLAVRISSQLDLHRCITKMPHTDVSCYTRTRLFFIVFLCDHHCSLICGQPPMTQEWSCLKRPSTLLQSDFSTRDDLFLVCQIELWSLNRQVFETFGADIHDSAASRSSIEVDRLSTAYDAWYCEWKRVLGLSQHQYPPQVSTFDLYYHAARLCLLSHIFRGRPITASPAPGKPDGRIQAAFNSALSIIQSITASEDAAKWLNTLPWYFCAIIAFACVCLVRMAFQLEEVTVSDIDRAQEQIKQLITILRLIPAARLPFLNIADCLESALSRRQQMHGSTIDVGGAGIETGSHLDWETFWDESIRSDLLGDGSIWMSLMNDNSL